MLPFAPRNSAFSLSIEVNTMIIPYRPGQAWMRNGEFDFEIYTTILATTTVASLLHALSIPPHILGPQPLTSSDIIVSISKAYFSWYDLAINTKTGKNAESCNWKLIILMIESHICMEIRYAAVLHLFVNQRNITWEKQINWRYFITIHFYSIGLCICDIPFYEDKTWK